MASVAPMQSYVKKVNGCYLYNNLLLHNGELLYVADTDEKMEVCALSVGFLHKMRQEKKDVRWSPKKVRNFDGTIDSYMEEVCFLNEEDVPGHVGHVVFDSVASQFSCLKLCGINLDEKSEITTIQILRPNEAKHHDTKGAYKLFYGKPKIYYDELCDLHMGKTVCIRTLIAGSSKKGVSYFDHTYTGNNGYRGAWGEFRDYAYLRSGAIARKTNDPIEEQHVIYATTDSTGRSDRKISNDEEVRAIINDHTQGKIVNWINMGSIRDQILVLCRARVYLSVDGSSGVNAVFLPDDALYINLGAVVNGYTGHINDFTYTGCDHFKVIYYNDYAQQNRVKRTNLTIDTALLAKMIQNPSGFYANGNRSVHGLKMISYIADLPPLEQKYFIFNLLSTELASACLLINNERVNVGYLVQPRDLATDQPLDSLLYLYMYHIFMDNVIVYEGQQKLMLSIQIGEK
jgi:hypothetical protein